MEWREACRDCILNHRCLLQEHGDVDECGDVEDYESDETEDPGNEE